MNKKIKIIQKKIIEKQLIEDENETRKLIDMLVATRNIKQSAIRLGHGLGSIILLKGVNQ